LTETGSTLLYPLFNVWASEYAKTHPGLAIKTAATGSGAGVDQARYRARSRSGTSDSYMSDADVRHHPLILNIPMAISAQTVNYNLPGLNSTNLKLDGPTLVGIYTGKIRTWDGSAIAALNPGMTLPHKDIIPRRGRGRHIHFHPIPDVFDRVLENNYGYGDRVAWPTVPGELEAVGNDGMVDEIKQTPYSVGYVGISSYADIAKAGIGTTALKSYSGEFLLPTPETIEGRPHRSARGRRPTSASPWSTRRA
jgi:phosphate transport system substrate-binding protein